MAFEKIKGDREIKALKPGASRLSDGGGLYLVPFAWGSTHVWRIDYTFEGKRKTLSLGTHDVPLDALRWSRGVEPSPPALSEGATFIHAEPTFDERVSIVHAIAGGVTIANGTSNTFVPFLRQDVRFGD